MVKITRAAIAEIERLKLSRHPDINLRLTVKAGGCLDFFYELEFESESELASGDRLIEVNDVKLAIDAETWKYVESLKLDYAEDLMGGGFRFHNSRAKKTCGCGISFTASKAQNGRSLDRV